MKNFPSFDLGRNAIGSGLSPPIAPNHGYGERIARGRKTGKRGHHATCVIFVKKLGVTHLSDWSTFPPSYWGSFYPSPGNIYRRLYELQCVRYGVDIIALTAKACLFEILP
ncbi:hypothetical protein TNCV_2730991 [Trichonephila clavipes]|nr:hypothetical protein TNCV_2730991 [Trichonephila clavipes]